jgi:PAS domain-containing protein
MSGSEKLIEIQQAKAAFRESEEHYRAVTEAATDAIITINSDSTILIVKPATERTFGYSTTELIGQPLTMLMPEISASSAQARNHALPGNWPKAYGVGSRAIARPL